MVRRFAPDIWRQLTATDFRLLEIVDHYHRTYGRCFLSRETLAGKLKVCERTVSRSSTHCVSLGVMSREQRRYRRRNGTYATETNVYQVLPFLGAKVRAILRSLTGATRKRTQSEPKRERTVSDFSFVKNEGRKAVLERFAKLGGTTS